MTLPWARTAAGVVGFFTIAAQTALVREYLVLFRGSEIAFGLFFGAWFAWIAVGATLVRATPLVRAFAGRHAAPLLALYPPGALLGIAAIPAFRLASAVPVHEPTPLGVLALGALAATAPVSLLTGVLFPALCERAAADSRSGATAGYAVEALGALLGGGLATAAVALGLDGFAVTGAAGLPVTVVALAGARGDGRRALVVPALAGLAALSPLAPGIGPPLRDALATLRLSASLSGAEWVRDCHTPYQLLGLARATGQWLLLADGQVSATFPPGPDVEARAALLASLPEARARAVVVGQGGLSLAAALTRYFADVECVVMDGEHGQLFREAWEASGAPRDTLDRVRLVTQDERAWAREAGPPADLWVVAGGEPATLLANRLYTYEFFADVRARLAPGGVVATPVRSAENYLGTEDLRAGQSVFWTLSAVFPVVTVAPGDEALFLAGSDRDRLTLDPAVLARRYESFASPPRPFPPDGFITMLPPDRVALAASLYASASPGDVLNRDDRPLAPFLHLLSFLRESNSPVVEVLWAVHGSGPSLAAGLLVLLALVLVRERVRRGPEASAFSATVLMATAGGVSISGFVALLAAYQSRVGAVYGEVGAATAAFMGGLAAGAFLGRGASRRVDPGRGRAWAVAYALVVGACVAAVPEVLASLDPFDPWARRVVVGGLLVALGVATGVAWPLAGILAGREAVGATLEAADHWGAALLVPVSGSVALALFGVDGTLWAVAGLLAVAAVVVTVDGLAEGRAGARFFRGRAGRLLASPAFPHRLWPALLAFLAMSAWLVWHASRVAGPGPVTRLDPIDLRRFETFTREEFREAPLPHHRLEEVQDPPGDAVLATTQAAAPDVKGYGGPINLVLSIGTDGHVRRVGVQSHRETPSYVRGLPEFLKALLGRDAREPLVVTDRPALDAMTGATVTRDAALQALDRTREALAAQVLGLPAASSRPSPPWWRPFAQARVWYVLASLVGLVLVHLFGTPRLRLAFLLIALVLGGFYFNVQLSTSWLLSLARGEWPVWEGNASMWLLGAGVLVLALLFGPVYCAHLCPFGALQEIVSRVSATLGILSRPAQALSVRVRGLKYAVLALAVLALFTRVPASTLRFDPLVTAFSGHPEGAGALVAVLALAGSVVAFRFWCRVFCPVGAFFLLFNRAASFLGLVPARRYPACDLDVRGPADLECLQCNRCAREAPAVRPMGRGVRPLAWAALLIATVAVVAWSFWTASGGVEAAPDASHRTLRTVHTETILRLIQEGRLSDKEAQFYVPAGP